MPSLSGLNGETSKQGGFFCSASKYSVIYPLTSVPDTWITFINLVQHFFLIIIHLGSVLNSVLNSLSFTTNYDQTIAGCLTEAVQWILPMGPGPQLYYLNI